MTDMREQIALMQTISLTPLENVIAGSVHVSDYNAEKVAVTWGGIAIIPRLQLESVRRVLDQERLDREMKETKDER